MKNRSKTLETITFHSDWTEEERSRWLEVWQQVRQARQELRTIVLATGVFDLFHEEHETFLRRARQAGNFLVVGVESDERVRALKGAGRPVNNEEKRLADVLAVPAVGCAAVLPEAFDQSSHHLALLKIVRPHVLAVSEHTPFQSQKKQLVEQVGGRLVVVHAHNPLVSTTAKIAAGIQ